MSLSTDGIKQAQKELRAYKNDLQYKCELFVSTLIENGIVVARSSATQNQFGQYITFEKKLSASKYGASGILCASSGTIEVQWMSYGKLKSADVSPLLMAEFGSGFNASDSSGKPNIGYALDLGMGQGTFPNQTHAFDAGGWWYQDLDGNWHNTTGVSPSMPVFNALLDMETKILTTAREVFQK